MTANFADKILENLKNKAHSNLVKTNKYKLKKNKTMRIKVFNKQSVYLSVGIHII